MNLRTKLLISLALVVVVGIALSSLVVYVSARDELEKVTRAHLEQSAEMLAKQSEAWLKEFRSDLVLWADLPIVHRVAKDSRNPSAVAEACRYFRDIIETHGVYQSINLHATDAACIASSISSRIGLKVMQRKVLTRVDFKTAAAGRTSVSSTLLSMGTGRPCIAISTPVREGKRVIGVLRVIVDLAFYTDFILRRQKVGHQGNASILDLNLDMSLPADWAPYDLIKGRKYRPPGIPLSSTELASDQGLVRYRGEKGDYLAAFHKIREPAWIIVVEQPLGEILAPIQFLRKTSIATALLLLVAVMGVVYFIMNPKLRDILMCLGMVRDIESGNLSARLHLRSKDEIGALARGLNSMAEKLVDNRRVLEEAERTYRGIFENALEGIFQSAGDLRLRNANPALAAILGYQQPEEVLGRPLSDHFADPGQWEGLVAALNASGTVRHFEFALARRDGTQGVGSLFAKAQRDAGGHIVQIQGMLADITQRRKAEQELQRAEAAEGRLIRSRLQALRYQLNPHFLFNLLNAIDILSRQAPQKISGLVRELSRYLRSTLAEHESGFVPLSRELETVGSYLNLEKVRFEDNLLVEIATSPGAGEALVPELLIQPLAENAVKHGMQTSPLPLKVVITATLAENRLTVAVANTGQWAGEPASSGDRGGIGLTNLRQRLELLFPGRHRFEVEAREGWVRVTMDLPAEGGAHDAQ
jgi:PAS domain S-box-containing protein